MFASEFQDATKLDVALDECHSLVLLQLVEAVHTHEVIDLRPCYRDTTFIDYDVWHYATVSLLRWRVLARHSTNICSAEKSRSKRMRVRASAQCSLI